MKHVQLPAAFNCHKQSYTFTKSFWVVRVVSTNFKTIESYFYLYKKKIIII